ncbi:MAG: TonB-dependent receptor [Ignavibacteriae bacterium]|nr:TonB-dependent receptor [Ignavibacteriota bacterium]
MFKSKIILNIIILVVVSLTSIPLFAQNDDNEQTGIKVKGRILDFISKGVLEGCSVQYMENDSIVLIVFSDDKGMFSLSIDTAKNSFIRLLKEDYETRVLPSSILSVDNLDTIFMVSSKYITDEITVEGELLFMQVEDDKYIFNLNKEIISGSRTLADLLRKIPLLSIDLEGNVTLNGSTPQFLMDGRKTDISSFLKQFPADIFSKIEILINPSSKYNSVSGTGIINLITKEETGYNIYGSVNADVTNQLNYNGGATLNYYKNKFNIGSRYSNSHYNNDIDYTSTRLSYLDSSTHEVNSSSTSGYTSNYGSISSDYSYGKENYFGLSGRFNSNISNNSSNTDESDINSNNVTTNFQRGVQTFSSKPYSLNLAAYNNITKGESEFYSEYDFEYRKYNSYNNFTIEDLFNSNDSYLRNESTLNTSRNHTVKLDYLNRINRTFGIESGLYGELNYIENNYSNSYSSVDSTSVSPNNFYYNNDIAGAYTDISFKILKLRTKFGGRLEYYYNYGNQKTTGEEFNNSYLDIMPYVNLSYKTNDFTTMKFSYSNRVSRPGYSRLNPYKKYSDPYHYSVGNPYLQPERRQNFEIGFNTLFEQLNINFSIFYKLATNVIERTVKLLEGNVAASTYDNISTSKSYGLSTYLTGQLFEVFNLNAGFRADKLDYSNYTSGGWNYNLNAGVYGELKNLFSWGANFYYSANSYSYQSSHGSFQSLFLYFGKDLFDEKLNIAVNIMNPFNKNTYNSDIYGENFKQTYKSTYNAQLFSLSVSYIFGESEDSQIKKKNNDRKPKNTPSDEGGLK